MQSDVVNISNQSKDQKQKLVEMQNSLQEMRSHFEETVQRLTNKEKDYAKLSKRVNMMSELNSALDDKVTSLSSELHDFKIKHESPSKVE